MYNYEALREFKPNLRAILWRELVEDLLRSQDYYKRIGKNHPLSVIDNVFMHKDADYPYNIITSGFVWSHSNSLTPSEWAHLSDLLEANKLPTINNNIPDIDGTDTLAIRAWLECYAPAYT